MSDLTSTYVENPRPFLVTAEDHSGIAIIVTTLLMVWTILCLLIRLYTRISQHVSLGLDDAVCGVATLMATVQTIIACFSIAHGFGKAEQLLLDGQLDYILKTQYAVSIICLMVLFSTKIDMILFHCRITPRKDQLYACYALMAVVAGSGVAAIIANCVRCNGDRPWDLEKQHCNNYVPIWTFVTVMDVSTEIAIFAMPCWIVWSLQLPTTQKLVVLSSFVLRLPLIVVSIVHLRYIFIWRSAEYPFVAAVDVFVQLQVEAHFATMAATIPALGTFMKSLNTRWGALDAQGLDASYAMHSYPTGSHNISDAASRAQSVAQRGTGPVPPDASNYSWKTQTAQGSDTRTTSKRSDDSEQMIIRKTVDMRVEHDG